jgi:hypothetical protein
MADDKKIPRPGPDTEDTPGSRHPNDDATGSDTGMIGGGGPGAHNPSAVRATGVDDPTAGSDDEADE